MTKKTIICLIVLIFSVSCLNIVSADNNTTDNLTADEEFTSYIYPVEINGNEIKFSDGFTGYCIDSAIDTISKEDKFILSSPTGGEHENYVKRAIIECYKAGREDNIAEVVSQVLNGNKDHDLAQAVFSSTENVEDTEVVNINNTTEATFTFELLKPSDGDMSNCLAYKVSLKTIIDDDTVADGNDTNGTEENMTSAANNETNQTDNTTQEKTTNQTNTTDNATQEKTNQTNNTTQENTTNQTNHTDNATNKQVIVNETNKTIINKTNTVIIKENNTTIINKNNTKVINKTNDTPQNATLQKTILRAVGNPIFLLAIVIVIAAAVITIRRKN